MAGVLGKLLPGKAENPDTDTEISDKSVNLLLDSTGVRIPDEEKLRTRVFNYIKQNWASREGKKSVQQLAAENKSPCAKYFLDQLITDRSIPVNLFNSISEKRKSGADEELIDSFIESKIPTFSGIFINGFFTEFKENFEFDKSGRPIGVSGTRDATRFGQACVNPFVSRSTIPEYYLDPALLGKSPPPPAKSRPPPLTAEQIARQAQRKAWMTPKAGKRRRNVKKTHRKTLRRVRHKVNRNMHRI